MTKRIVHILASVWLAIILLFGTTPKEFLHLFAGHTDTVDHISHNQKDRLVVENEHHHCNFLGFELMPFAADYQLPRIAFVPTEYLIMHEALKLHYIQRNIVRTTLRGPPVA